MAKAKSQGGRKSTRLLWRWDGERKQIYLICNLPQKASLEISKQRPDGAKETTYAYIEGRTFFGNSNAKEQI